MTGPSSPVPTATADRTPAVSPRYLAWLAVLLVGMVLGALALRVVDTGTGGDLGSQGSLTEGRATETPTDEPTPSPLPTTFTISSLNVLGHGHTAPGGNRPGWADSAKRMQWQVELLRSHDVDVVGFQELQAPQYDEFTELTAAEWGMYPGNVSRAQLRNSIAWRLDTWELVSASWILVPVLRRREDADAGDPPAQPSQRPAGLLRQLPQPGQRARQRRAVA